METRNSAKRKGEADTEPKSVQQGPAKRTRAAAQRQTQHHPPAAAPAPKSTRSGKRAAQQRTPRSRSTPDTAAEAQAAVDQAPQAPPAAPAQPGQAEPAAGPAQDNKQADESMDRSGRRNSRGDPPSGGGEDERVSKPASDCMPWPSPFLLAGLQLCSPCLFLPCLLAAGHGRHVWQELWCSWQVGTALVQQQLSPQSHVLLQAGSWHQPALIAVLLMLRGFVFFTYIVLYAVRCKACCASLEPTLRT
jgi:hypothetical protein